MGNLCILVWCVATGLFRSRAALQAEILVLRHQLNVLRRKSPERIVFSNIDRLVFMVLYRLIPQVLDALKILKPETGSVGIARAFEPIGAGNHDLTAAGQKSQPRSASLFET